MPTVSEYTRKYTSFSGADIVATFNGQVCGELQQITYSVTREKVPIYTMGSADPRSFSRGKRGIAGSIVFTTFDRDVFSSFYKEANDSFTNFWTNLGNASTLNGADDTSLGSTDGTSFYNLSIDDWEYFINENQKNHMFVKQRYRYSDEIMPFDVTITMHNEYGQSASMSILGVEILNEGSGYGIDDITTSKACTFIARRVTPLQSHGTSWKGKVGETRLTKPSGYDE